MTTETSPAASSEPALTVTDRSAVKRRPQRGSHERAAINAVLDEAFVCHVAVLVDGSPRLLPQAHVRVGDHVYLHGAPANRILGALADGAPACLTVTLLDGLVLARSAFHHSMNYRCVVLYGVGEPVEALSVKRDVLSALVDHLYPGRSTEAKSPTDAELRATLVVRFPVTEGSLKVRSGPPIDDAEDVLTETCWAGVVPLSVVAGPPVADPDLPVGQAVPPALAALVQALSRGPGDAS